GEAERVAAEDREVERRTDREIALDRRVERHERAARRVLQRHLRPDDAVEDGLPVLTFAELQVRGLRRAPDAVALRVEQIERRWCAPDLPAQDARAAHGDPHG